MLVRLRDRDRLLDLSFFSASEEEVELLSAFSFSFSFLMVPMVPLILLSRDFLGGALDSFLSFDLERLGSEAAVVPAPTPSLSGLVLAGGPSRVIYYGK